MIKIKSVYDKPLDDDGERILVDLFWPEGLKTRYAKVDQWYHELGPTYDLQRFYFDISKWQDYRSAYEEEILASESKKKLLQELMDKSKKNTITLLYGNKDPEHNHAVILKELMQGKLTTNKTRQ